MLPSIENIHNITSKRKSRTVSSFLKKTFQLLNEPYNSDCIKWAPNGIGFIVTNEELFSRTVLPKYFKHNNYSSFVRQLNMYNFHKIRQANSESYFHHQCFDRSDKEAMSEIKRKPQKKKRKNQESEDERDQNQQSSFKPKRVKEVQSNVNHRVASYERVSINLLGEEGNQQFKSQKNTRNLFSQTFYTPQQIKSSQIKDESSIESQKNLLSMEDDDRLSINDEIAERIPRLTTKELFSASTNNLFPFPFLGNIQPSTFSLFF